MKRDGLRLAIFLLVAYIALWYAGAMLNFLPFLGDDVTLRAVGYTGLLLAGLIVACTAWILRAIRGK